VKNFMLLTTMVAMGFSSFAATSKKFTESDYRKEDFVINSSATEKLKNPCAKSALAAFGHTVGSEYERQGLDFDAIYVDKVNYLKNLGVFVIKSSGPDIYSVLTERKNGKCQASVYGIDRH